MPDDIVIRPLKTMPQMSAMQEVERSVWGIDPIPTHQTFTAAKNGGVVLGAFQGDQMVGMLYSFPGFINNEIYLCSHMMGIRGDLRHLGIGERLKRAQGEAALKRGYRLVTWTYDPLETVNGYVNIGKLGAVCSTYIEDCYGEMTDKLNQGLSSDRFQVEWWINQGKPTLPRGDIGIILGAKLSSGGTPEPEPVISTIPDNRLLAVAVPANFQAIKQNDAVLAKEWRQATRRTFNLCFGAGWAVAGFNLRRGEPVHQYLLVKREELSLPRAPW